MPSKKSCKGPLGKNGQSWTERQKKLIAYIPTSKSHAEAAVKAGYPTKNAAQSAYQALRLMRGRVPELMDQIGISERDLIDNHLRRLLSAERTVFVQEGRKTAAKYTVVDSQTRLRALHLAFLLHGSYTPRDPKEAAQFGVKVIKMDIRDRPRPLIDVKPGIAIPEMPTDATGGAKTAIPEDSERPTDKRRNG